MRRVPSPNCDTRPASEEGEVSLLVIHNISLPPGKFGGGYIEQLFTNCLPSESHPYFTDISELEVSAHVLIDRWGKCTQFVAFEERAWHAGESCFAGRNNCNDFSVGIELEGTDSSGYTDVQYSALGGLTRSLMRHYPAINRERVVGHSDIAPGRKTDPGPGFDWQRYYALFD